MTETEREWIALRIAYGQYRGRFAGTYAGRVDIVPLTPRQFCGALVLCDKAWQDGDLTTVSELQRLMLIEEVQP